MNLNEDNLANIGERRPGDAWTQDGDIVSVMGPDTYAISVWTRGRYRVISELCVAELPGGGVGPQWLVSISRRGNRIANGEECRRILRQFGIGGAEEDNHEPGRVRKFWLPLAVDERGIACPCKDEEVVVRDDGYRYSRKVSTAAEYFEQQPERKARWVDVADIPDVVTAMDAVIDAARGLGDGPSLGGVRATPNSEVVAGGTTRHNVGRRCGG